MSGVGIVQEALDLALYCYWGNQQPAIEGKLEQLCYKLKEIRDLVDLAKCQTDPLWAAHLLEPA